MSENPVVMEQANDPDARARERRRILDEQADRNYQWLRAHWPEILPRARGKGLAVAGQELFIADTPEEALALARAAHPEDEGLIYSWISPGQRLVDNLVTIYLGDDPIVTAWNRAQNERIKRNSE
jgi:hypothetical protein